VQMCKPLLVISLAKSRVIHQEVMKRIRTCLKTEWLR